MTKLVEYNREIAPMIRQVEAMKEELKDFVDGLEGADVLRANIKREQEVLAEFLNSNDDVKQMLADIKEVNRDIQQAVKAAAKGSGYKPKELKDYFFARAQEDKVVKIVQKGKVFDALNEEIDS